VLILYRTHKAHLPPGAFHGTAPLTIPPPVNRTRVSDPTPHFHERRGNLPFFNRLLQILADVTLATQRKALMNFLRLATLLLFALVATTHANALTIDAFVNDGSISSTSVVGTTKTAYLPSSRALGGGRSLSATKSGSGTGISRLEIVDSSIGYTQGAHTGYASISWDGDTDASTIKPDGLGSVDMTQDGGTAFKIGLMFFDYPSNQSVQLKVRLYDASFANGSKYSEVAISLN
jgi:hypothetical protein